MDARFARVDEPDDVRLGSEDEPLARVLLDLLDLRVVLAALAALPVPFALPAAALRLLVRVPGRWRGRLASTSLPFGLG